jgi:predicted lipoprotein with Yx(FWY)xxD motif
MRNTISGFAILAALAGTTLLTACGSDTAEGTSSETTTIAATSAVQVVDSSLGPIVADESGRTLYAFTKDTNGVSTCYDACATTWPPAVANSTELLGSGVDADLIGTTDRKDGTKQLTLNGMPLYRFAADGDTTGAVKGQANKGVWFVVDADGALLKDTVKKSPTTYSYDY